jgi:hydroxymethylpyrimidine/phosphomethylpyrimidine kinase
MTRSNQPPTVLTIAGSDPGGSAGMQADLKTFAAFGVHGLSVITAITAQNTRSVSAVRVLPAALVLAQLDALRADFNIAAVKIGMLGNAANVRAVATWLRANRLRHIVVDPVLVSSSGRVLLDRKGTSVLREELLPLADVLTPNLPEAHTLLGKQPRSLDDLSTLAQQLRALGTRSVLLKGGHARSGRSVRDIFVDTRGIVNFEHARLRYAVRGTGCALASAIAAGLARGAATRVAVRDAEAYLQRAYAQARKIGKGAARVLAHIE